jgi:hypothetical protein
VSSFGSLRVGNHLFLMLFQLELFLHLVPASVACFEQPEFCYMMWRECNCITGSFDLPIPEAPTPYLVVGPEKRLVSFCFAHTGTVFVWLQAKLASVIKPSSGRRFSSI